MNALGKSSPSKTPLNKVSNIVLWILQILIAIVFIGSGYAKLSGQPMMVEIFDRIGMGQWFRYMTGGIEMMSALLLFVPSLVFVGAELLACTMICAVVVHLEILGGSPVPAIILLFLCSIIAWGRSGSFEKSFSKTNRSHALPLLRPQAKCENE